MTGVLSISGQGKTLFVSGQMQHMPNQDELELRVMEYGDMSSLVVEYPDYNSFGLPIVSLGKTSGSGSWSTDFQKFQSTVTLPESS
jgi:hypothetical protein